MKNKFISALLAGCLVVGCIGPVSAEEITTADGTGTVPVELTAEALTFSVTVPTSLPVGVAADGTVTTADNAKIVNNSAGPVEVKSVTAEAVSPWEMAAWSDTDTLSGEKIGSKKFALSMQGKGVAADGTCAAEFDSIAANDELPFEYNAHIAPQAVAINNEQMAKVVFTVGWQELYTPFTVTSDNRREVGYKWDTKNLVIPAIFQKNGTLYKITSIGDYAFNDCTKLESITIPDGVTNIRSHAFHSCSSLTSINIPNGVTSIENGTFYACEALKSIAIPDSVTSIGESAFEFCDSFTSITIPDSVTSIGKEAFKFCRALESITIPEGVTSIGEGVFANSTALTSIMWKGHNDEQPYISPAEFETAWNTAHGTDVNIDGL